MGADNLAFIQIEAKPVDDYGDEYYDEEDPEESKSVK